MVDVDRLWREESYSGLEWLVGCRCGVLVRATERIFSVLLPGPPELDRGLVFLVPGTMRGVCYECQY